MKTRSQITFASLALLIAGSSLLYTTPASIVKAEPTQNVSSSLQTRLNEIGISSSKQCGIHCNLDTRGYLLKLLRVEKLELCRWGSESEHQETNENRFSLSHW